MGMIGWFRGLLNRPDDPIPSAELIPFEPVPPRPAVQSSSPGAPASLAPPPRPAPAPDAPAPTPQAHCPTCAGVLTRKPSRKARCPHCGALILVRTGDADGELLFLTEAQAAEMDAHTGATRADPDQLPLLDLPPARPRPSGRPAGRALPNIDNPGTPPGPQSLRH